MIFISFFHELVLEPDALVLPLLVSVKVRLFLRAVVGDFIVHPVGYGGGKQSLVVSERLAAPDDINVFRCQCRAVGRVNVLVEIVYDGFNRKLNEFLCVRKLFLLKQYAYPRRRAALWPLCAYAARAELPQAL